MWQLPIECQRQSTRSKNSLSSISTQYISYVYIKCISMEQPNCDSVENICGVVFCGRSWESSTQVLAIQMTEKNPLQIVRTRKTEWQCFGTENWHKRERHRAKWEKNWCSAKSFKRICTYGDNDHFLYSYSVSALPSHYMLFLLSICLFDVAVGHYCLRLCVPVNDDYKCSIRARNPAVNVMFDQEQEYADWNWLTSSTFEISNLSNIEIQRNNTPLSLSGYESFVRYWWAAPKVNQIHKFPFVCIFYTRFVWGILLLAK